MDPADAESVTLLRALVALQIAERQERASSDAPRPTELVLADAGLSLADISALTGRKYETVRTTIRRGREAAAKSDGTTKTRAKNAAKAAAAAETA
jgi:DNA-directed RNA polymerase specialized sigma24 family protein